MRCRPDKKEVDAEYRVTQLVREEQDHSGRRGFLAYTRAYRSRTEEFHGRVTVLIDEQRDRPPEDPSIAARMLPFSEWAIERVDDG